MADRRVEVARRRLIQAGLAGAAARLALATVSPATALDKMTKQEAEYQDTPKDIRMCATCSLFDPPRACKVVEGDVSPNGWCKVFAIAD